MGFIGVGLTYSFFGVSYYAFIGYSSFAYVNADLIQWYAPPNAAPVISDETPVNGEKDVPVTLNELSFRISDADNDRMSYSVTTSPDIGSGSGSRKKNGVYKVPISGLEELTEYSWKVIVSDKYDTVEKTFIFTTEAEAPIISNPIPENDAINVQVDLSEISFILTDYQGDLIDYTVETSPDIGSSSGNGVGNGRYNMSISGLDYYTDYTWFVNATDGKHFTNEVFNFQTRRVPGSWWDSDWGYYKVCNINNPLDDYQIKIIVGKSVGGNVTCEGHCQDDFDDLRFISGTYISEVPYWIQNYTSGEQATIWINNFYNDSQILMYYGNSSAEDNSNGDATFWFFDDFPGSSLDTSKWDSYGTVSVSNSKVNMIKNAGSGAVPCIKSDIKYSSYNKALHSKLYINSLGSTQYGMNFHQTGADENVRRMYFLFSSTSSHEDYYLDYNGGGYDHYGDFLSWSTGMWYELVLKSTPGESVKNEWDRDGTTHTYNIAGIDSTPLHILLGKYIYGISKSTTGTTNFDFDWVFLRNYTRNEPYWSNFGDEQTPP